MQKRTPRKEATRSLEILSEILRKISVKQKVIAERDVSDLNIFIKENSGPVTQYINSWFSKPSSSEWSKDIKIIDLNDSIYTLHEISLLCQHLVSYKYTVMIDLCLTPAEAVSATITHTYNLKN